jgi:hypothetical protein
MKYAHVFLLCERTMLGLLRCMEEYLLIHADFHCMCACENMTDREPNEGWAGKANNKPNQHCALLLPQPIDNLRSNVRRQEGGAAE